MHHEQRSERGAVCRLNFLVPRRLRDRLAEAARQHDRSLAGEARWALERHVNAAAREREGAPL